MREEENRDTKERSGGEKGRTLPSVSSHGGTLHQVRVTPQWYQKKGGEGSGRVHS